MIYISIAFVPLLIGYAYGANHIDPNTPEGAIYYSTGELT